MIETDRDEILREFDPLTSKEVLMSHNDKTSLEETDKQSDSVQSEKLHSGEEALEHGKQRGKLNTIQPSGKATSTTSTTTTQSQPQQVHSEGPFFDFQLFIRDLRQPTALPLIKYTKSFLFNFCTQNVNARHRLRKQSNIEMNNNNNNNGNNEKLANTIWTADEQAKLIRDFKVFIYDKLGLYEPFSSMDEAHLLNAKEGMEKLIMGKLYTRCFSPLALRSTSGGPLGVLTEPDDPHRDDIVQDRLLRSKVLEYQFIELSNLGEVVNNMSAVAVTGMDKFVKLAGRELNKINDYKSPRDKMVCILNCCKVIFGLLRHYKLENSGADSFVPMLIYVVLKNNVDDLVSNIRYIERFRYSEFLKGEEEYYLSSLQGATKFVIGMEKKDLNIKDEEEFQRRYEANQRLLREEGLKETKIEENEVAPNESSTTTTTNLTASASSNPFGEITSSMKSLFGDLFTAGDNSEGEQEEAASGNGRPNGTRNDRASPSKRRAPRVSNGDETTENLEAIIKEIEERDRRDTVTTLSSMFPDLPEDLVQDVCVAQKYRIGVCVDTLLEFYGQN